MLVKPPSYQYPPCLRCWRLYQRLKDATQDGTSRGRGSRSIDEEATSEILPVAGKEYGTSRQSLCFYEQSDVALDRKDWKGLVPDVITHGASHKITVLLRVSADTPSCLMEPKK